MKLFPLKVLNKIEKTNGEIYPILFYGNEVGLISSLIKSIKNMLQKKLGSCDIKYFDYKDEKNEELINIFKSSSLFSNITLVVVKNPQEKIVADLTGLNIYNNVLIINGENITTKSKIKSYFDGHKNFISVPCYSLDRGSIKITIDTFLNNNNILLNRDAYRFLIENINEDYLSLENELKKLYIFKDSPGRLEDLQGLITQKNNVNTDNYFFNCAAGNYDPILQDINSSNKSINDSYEILFSLKRLINVTSGAVANKSAYSTDELVKYYLPKYLFLKKEAFRKIIIKISSNKIAEINKMLQKTEYLIRKNASQHRQILERFLLNLVKIMK